MKKTLVALAAFASVSAFAQSAVTISGIVNYGINNATTQPSTSTSNQQWGGLKGDRNKLSFDVTEDLGGGLSTIAKLEARFNLASGQTGYANGAASTLGASGTTLFEQTMIGIKSAQFGEIKMGRFTNTLGAYDFSVFEDSKFGTNASQASYGRHNSQIQFTSPTISGFTLSAVGANFANNKWGQGTGGWGFLNGVDYSVYSATGFSNFGAATLTYANGPLVAQFAKLQGFFNDKATRIGANYTLASGVKVYGGFYNQQGNVGQVISTLTASYTVPVAAVANTAAGLAAGTTTGMAEHSATELGLMVPVGQFNLRAGMVRNSKDLLIGQSDGTTKAEKIGMGVEYNLSKRTQVQYQRSTVKTGIAVGNGTLGGGFGYTTGSTSGMYLQHSF